MPHLSFNGPIQKHTHAVMQSHTGVEIICVEPISHTNAIVKNLGITQIIPKLANYHVLGCDNPGGAKHSPMLNLIKRK